MSHGNGVTVFIVAVTVFGIVWKISKYFDIGDPDLQDASRQERRQTVDAGQAQVEAEADEHEDHAQTGEDTITPSEIELEIQAKPKYLEEKREEVQTETTGI